MQNNNKFIKIVLLGDAGVGKSNIVSRFLKNVHMIDMTNTIGVEFVIKNVNINDKTYKIQLWDTAGQERFKSIIKSYYRYAHGIILVYDITNRTSFDNINNWLNDIQINCGNPSVQLLLVGNKIDLEKDRQISYKEGLCYAKSKSLDFIETSSYYDINNELSNINIMINIIIGKIINNGNFNINDNNNIDFNNNNIKINKLKKCCIK